MGDEPIPALAQALGERARARGHRGILILSGGAEWTRAHARQVIEALPGRAVAWLGESSAESSTGPSRSPTELLGQEVDLLVHDTHAGFDPDGFGAATGAIRAGGLLILLTPPLSLWPHRPDPEAERIAVWPHTAATVGRRFMRRLAGILASAPEAIQLAQDDPSSIQRAGLGLARVGSAQPRECPLETPPGVAIARHPDQPATPDQARAIAAILALARGRAHRPLVIRADRGRGKSAALGLAAAQLARAGHCRILVTAPRRAATATLFQHARAAMAVTAQATAAASDSSTRRGSADTLDPACGSGSGILFRPPAELLEAAPPADLLLVDEAAGIPAPLLERLLRRYPRIVFATTVHGYEGTGRGFEVRFRETLDRLTPGWRALELATPIRWSAGDPLEALTLRALLLAAAPAHAGHLAASPRTEMSCERLDRDRLAADETTLSELFGLLVLAHYQTRPMDLRMLLDGPNVRLYGIRRGGHIAATLLAAAEGGFTDPALCEAIYMGQRRPRGHLLAQTLSSHAGLAEAPRLRYLRVIRIAVHPALRRQGLGRRLLEQLARDARADSLDLIGASFGATPDLVGFWAGRGFVPAQLGTHRNAASGEHALVMLAPVSRSGERLTAHAVSRLEARLPVLLAGPLRDLDPASLVAIMAAQPPHPANDRLACAEDAQELAGFIRGHRTLEASLPLLAELTRQRLGQAIGSAAISAPEAALLVAATRQLQPIAKLVNDFALTGRDELIRRLRLAAAALSHAHPHPVGPSATARIQRPAHPSVWPTPEEIA